MTQKLRQSQCILFLSFWLAAFALANSKSTTGTRPSNLNTIGVSIYELQPGWWNTISGGDAMFDDAFEVKQLSHIGVFFIPGVDMSPNKTTASGTQSSDFGWGRKVDTGKECGANINLGVFPSAAHCAAVMEDHDDCDPYFMWSEYSSTEPTWGCRCCTKGKTDGGAKNANWNLYESYGNWLCFDEGDDNGMPSQMKWQSSFSNGDGKCGVDISKEAADLKDKVGGIEVTFSNGKGGQYNQTYAYGEPGRYMTRSSGDAIWHGKAATMYWVTTDLSFEDFMMAAQSNAYISNSNGGYDLFFNNCQDYSLRLLQTLNAPNDLLQQVKDYKLHPDTAPYHAVKWVCSLFKLSMCWSCANPPICNKFNHVSMSDSCKKASSSSASTVTPTYYDTGLQRKFGGCDQECRSIDTPSMGGKWCNGHDEGSLDECWGWCGGGCWGTYEQVGSCHTRDACSVILGDTAPLCKKNDACQAIKRPSQGGKWCNGHDEGSLDECWGWCGGGCWGTYEEVGTCQTEDACSLGQHAPLCKKRDACQAIKIPSQGGKWCNGHDEGSLDECWGWCGGGCWDTYEEVGTCQTEDACSLGQHAPLCKKKDACQAIKVPSQGGKWCNGHDEGSLDECWGWCNGGCWDSYDKVGSCHTGDSCFFGTHAPLCKKK